MKSYVTNGTGSQQTLTGSQDEKVAVYQTVADAEADLANLKAGQIVATPDTGDENAQPVDSVTDGDMHAVTSNAVFDTYAVISASSTVITGKPISQRSVIKIMFTSAISGSDTTTAMSISYNGTSYPVKVGKNGSLSNFTASEISSGTYRYLQAYTTLELAFDGTQFIIIGNPVVLSSSDYTIYADGTTTYKSTIMTTMGGKTGIVYGTTAVKDETDVTLPIEFKNINYVIIAWYKWNDTVVWQNAEPKTNKIATFKSDYSGLHTACYIAIGEIN